MTRTTRWQDGSLQLHVRDFGNLSAAMTVLAESAPERMSISQAIFFVRTATADLAGQNPTFSEIRDTVGSRVNRSLHTTYRVFLEPGRNYPQGLGWLQQEENPADTRQKFLRLTSKGRAVMVGVLEALSVDQSRADQ